MMTRAQTITLHVAVALTTITGAVFAVMKYAMKSDDPFAVVNHPLQPHMLAAHVLIAPLLVFTFGWIFGNHVAPAVKRRSGLVTLITMVPMIASGYLMQISTADATRQAMTFSHWLTSAFFVIAYAIHLLTRRNKAREGIDEAVEPRQRSVSA